MAEVTEADQIKTFRDFMANYNKLSETCFSDCVWDFSTRKVLNSENTCVLNCAEKYLKMNQRVSARFQEFQLLANENAVAQATKAGRMSM